MRPVFYYILIGMSWFLILIIPWGFLMKNKQQWHKDDQVFKLSEEDTSELSSILQAQKQSMENAVKMLNLKVEGVQEVVKEQREFMDNQLSEMRIALRNDKRAEKKINTQGHVGEIRQGVLCMDSLERGYGQGVGLFECHGEGGNQEWFHTMDHTITQRSHCLTSPDTTGKRISIYVCQSRDPLQMWVIEGNRVRSFGREYCLDSTEKENIRLEPCKLNQTTQIFSWHPTG